MSTSFTKLAPKLIQSITHNISSPNTSLIEWNGIYWQKRVFLKLLKNCGLNAGNRAVVGCLCDAMPQQRMVYIQQTLLPEYRRSNLILILRNFTIHPIAIYYFTFVLSLMHLLQTLKFDFFYLMMVLKKSQYCLVEQSLAANNT